MRSETPANRDLVLVGGGHTHALVLRNLAMRPVPDLRVTLISPAAFTPYSGMLPGLLAGHYTFEETHIDLARLCQWAGVRFLTDTVLALDPDRQTLRCERRGEIGYDVVSLDIGSQPELDSVPGARAHAVPVKPVAGLWTRWCELASQSALDGQKIAVVGGGAGSVELALAIAHRLNKQVQIDLYCGGAVVLEGYADGARATVEAQLKTLGIGLHTAHRVARVEEGVLQFNVAAPAAFDTLIWSTGAAAAGWVAESGLPVDARGFLLVEDTLQSIGASNVFAAGDIATQQRHPRPKAGVYAVRQGPVLANNLRAMVSGGNLRQHRPQKDFLSLLALGAKRAVAQRNGLSVSGAWVWRWKNRIDRAFMRQFSDLPPRRMRGSDAKELPQAPCGGCGAKVGADSLTDVLARLRQRYPEYAPPAHLDDTVQLAVRGELVQTLDALRALVDDPWQMGRIAAQHALSDVYASGARPHSALALVTLPFASPALTERDLEQVLEGALSVLSDSGCPLLGGHSMQGPELQVAFAVNAQLGNECMLPKRGAQVGDALILAKALGSGALFAAHMQAKADGRDITHALTSMEQSNARAATLARQHQATAATDVTGFGLAGHLREMLAADPVGISDEQPLAAKLYTRQLPVLPGALAAMEAGIFSTLHESNRRASLAHCDRPPAGPIEELIFDPQTSGGLLMSVPAGRAEVCVAALLAAGYDAANIGYIEPADSALRPLQLRLVD